MRTLLPLLPLLRLAIPASAAELCVSVSGSGAADGTDWDNTLAQSFTPVRGNTYYVADGSYSGKTWTISRSGASYITVKKATEASHGPATGWLSTMGDGEAVFSGEIQIRSSEFIFDGATRTDWDSGYGFRVAGGSTISLGVNFGLEVTNVTVRYTQVDGSDDPSGSAEDNLASVGNKRNITVEYCYFHDPGNSVMQLNGTQNFIVQYCLLARNQGSEGAHSEILVLTGCDDVTVRYNIIDESESTAAIGTPTGGHPECAGDDNSNWYIYGNVFRKSSTGAGSIYIFDCTISGDFYVVNNTFWSSVSWNARVGFSNGSGSDGCADTMVARNNLFFNATQTISTANVTAATVTHNAFFDSADTGTDTWDTSGDPLEDGENYDFDLDSAVAAAMTAGFTLVNVGSHTFDVDMNGVTRGADGKWDRGAFEFGSGGGGGAPATIAAKVGPGKTTPLFTP